MISRYLPNRFLGVITIFAAFSQQAHAQQYTLTQIPVPNLSSYPTSANVSGAYVVGYGLNNSGVVVGNVGGVIGNAPTQPFVYQQGGSQLLPYLATPEDYATATAINPNGIIVGESSNAGLAQGNAVAWQNGSISDLGSLYYYTSIGPSPVPAYSSAAAVNSKGDVVGLSLGVEGGSITTDTHAVLFSGGTVVDLGTLGGNNSEAFGINDSGIIVGDADTAPGTGQSSQSHAFYYNGSMHDLGVLLGGTASSATAINASGTIVGYSALTGGTHAVVWTPNNTGGYAIADLGTLGPLANNYAKANAINSSGQIVGITSTPQFAQTAFIYRNGVMTDLNTLLPAGSSVTLYEATAINDSGQILAYSLNYATNVRTTYLLTPVAQQSPTALIELVSQVTGKAQPGAVTSVQVNEGDFIQFTAQDSSDPNVPGSPLTYQWKQIAGPSGQSFAFTYPLFNIIVPDIGDNSATMTYQLTVTDALGLSSSATVNVEILPPIQPPVASIVSPDTPYAEGSLVTIDASASRDPYGFALQYSWFQFAGPTGFPLVALNLTNPARPTFTAPRVGHPATYGFELVLSDGQATSTAEVVLTTIPAAAITVPSVVGATQSAAGAALASSGLVIGTTAQQSSMTILSGLVISQSPLAGASVADGSVVNLVLSTGSTCANVLLVKAAFGSKLGQPSYNAIADVNHDGVVNVVDLSTVSRALPAGTTCK